MPRKSAVLRRPNGVALAAFILIFAAMGLMPSLQGATPLGVTTVWALGDPDDGNGRLRMPEDGGGVGKPAESMPPKPTDIVRLILAQSRVLLWILVRTPS